MGPSFTKKTDPISFFALRVSAPTHVQARLIGCESLLLNLNSRRYFGLNEVGTRMWTLLTAGQPVQAAYEALLAEYDVDAEQLRQNLRDLIDRLAENGLIEVRGEQVE